jgi:hypothetical protein
VRFTLGRTVGTPAALRAIAEAGQEPRHFLDLHASGAWGDLDQHDRQSNEVAIASGERIVSTYVTALDVKLYVITEHDRSMTTILLPEEY